MCMISLDDAKKVVGAANVYRITRDDGAFTTHLSIGDVDVQFSTTRGNGQTLVNYGLPYQYKMSRADIPALTQWWHEQHPTTGDVLPPQFAYGGWKINIQWRSTNNNLFNFHLGVP